MHVSAEASCARSPLRPRAGRNPRDRGAPRHRLPPERRACGRRDAGRRRLLHAVRLPDHRPAARLVAAARRPPPGPLLAAPRAAPASGPVPDARRRQPLGGALRLVAALGRAPAGVGGGAVRQQLVDDRAERLVLRPFRATAAARPSVVARDRGAVLHRLAVPAPRADLVRAQPQEDGARHARRGRRVGAGDGPGLPARLRPDARVRRHGHARLRAPDRVRAGDGVADAVGDRQPRPVRVEGAGRDRARRAARDLCAGCGDEHAVAVPLPVGIPAPLVRDRRARRRRGEPREQARRRARLGTAPLDRRPLVRDLPLALADRRPPASEVEHVRPRLGGPGRRPHVRDLGTVVEVRRGADPPGRARPALEGSARRRGAARRAPPRARAVGRGRGGAPRVRARAERDAAGGLCR